MGLIPSMIPIIVMGIFCYIIVGLINNGRLNIIGNKIIDNPTDELVESYINILRYTPINNTPSNWQKLRSSFFCVYNSENVSINNKKELYTRLIKKGCILGNVNLKFIDNEERKKQSGEKGERTVAYNLKWLPKEYKILYNVRLQSKVESQEFDNIVIGPNGIFHVETKNYGGEHGCKIKIDKSGNWVREYNGNESGLDSPEFQLSRHQMVLEENINRYYGEKGYDVNGVVVLSNPKTILEGAENSDIDVIKAEGLIKYIQNKKATKVLSKIEIEDIYRRLK